MKHSDEKIEQAEKIVAGTWQLIYICFNELWVELKDFFYTLKRNFYWRNGTRKVATVLFAIVIILPAGYSYLWIIKSAYIYARNISLFDKNKQVLEGQYVASVKNFFQEYNEKSWVDCDWMKEVNVDMNMDKLWTQRKPGKLCSLNQKSLILPVTIENPIADTAQYARVGWKAFYIIMNGTTVQNVWYQRYELYRKMEWDINKWKFNPFPQEEKERIK